MPEAGRTPTVAFEKGTSLPQGGATQANTLMGLVGAQPEPEPYVPKGEEEQFLYAPTDRPAEPVTAGAPFGPGPDATKHAMPLTTGGLVEQTIAGLQRIPNPPREVRAFIERASRGL